MTLSAAFSDDMAAQLVLGHLGRGRDNAASLSAIAEQLGWSRRAVEHGVNRLRLSGWPVCSDGTGIWLGDTEDVAATYRQLRGRIESQNRTCWALRATLRRLRAGEVHQERLPWSVSDAA